MILLAVGRQPDSPTSSLPETAGRRYIAFLRLGCLRSLPIPAEIHARAARHRQPADLLDLPPFVGERVPARAERRKCWDIVVCHHLRYVSNPLQ